MDKKLTNEQLAILVAVDSLINDVKNNNKSFSDLYTVLQMFQLEALAGTGKTFMFEKIIEKIVDAFPTARILVLSFTNKAVDELKKRLVKILPSKHNVIFSTISAFGGKLIKQKYNRISYDADGGVNIKYDQVKEFATSGKDFFKSDSYKKSISKKKNKEKLRWIMYNNKIGTKVYEDKYGKPKTKFRYSAIVKQYDKIIGLFKNYNLTNNDLSGAISILEDHGIKYNENVLGDVLRLLELSRINHKEPQLNKKTGKRDYNMAFTMEDLFDIPLIEKIVPNEKFDFIFVDEFQDCNLAQVRLLKQISEKSVMFVVGDINQAIFFHAGAVGDAFSIMEKGKRLVKKFTLSWNFRCSEAAVKDANEIVPALKAFPGAKKGKIVKNSTIDYITSRLNSKNLVVSYTNANLFNLAIEFIRLDKKCLIKGADFDELMYPLYKAIYAKVVTVKGIEGFYRRTIKAKIVELADSEYFFDDIAAEEDYQVKELKTTLKQIIKLMTKFDFASKGKVKIIEFIDIIKEYLVDDIEDADIELSTMHKVKGGEWDNVFIHNVEMLNEEWMNATPKARKQNENLLYVIRTRTKNDTVYFTLDLDVEPEIEDTDE